MSRGYPSYYDFYVGEVGVSLDYQEFEDHPEVDYDDVVALLVESGLVGRHYGADYEGNEVLVIGDMVLIVRLILKLHL